MKLCKEEEVYFKKGDINNWDFLFIISVFWYLKICVFEMSKRFGYYYVL